LQRVLDIRAKEEETKRAELLEITERLLEITERLAETRGGLLTRQRILKDIISDIAEKKLQKRLGAQEFFLKYSITSDEEIKKLQNKVSELESQQRGKIVEVLKARRSKEGLEKLRAEAKRQFIENQEKLEQKDLDEMAGISFVRNRDPVLQIQ
jgi:flagellar export protein FliJ